MSKGDVVRVIDLEGEQYTLVQLASEVEAWNERYNEDFNYYWLKSDGRVFGAFKAHLNALAWEMIGINSSKLAKGWQVVEV